MFNSVPDDQLVLWNGRKLRELSERLGKLETKSGSRTRPPSTARSNTFVMVVNDTGSNWQRGRVVGTGDTLIKPGDIAEDLAYEYQDVFEFAQTNESTKKFGIVANATPNGMRAKVIVSGFTNAVVNVTSLSHDYAQTTETDGVLESTSEPTSILILYANAVGPNELCKVLIGSCCCNSLSSSSESSEPSESFSDPSESLSEPSESFSESSDISEVGVV